MMVIRQVSFRQQLKELSEVTQLIFKFLLHIITRGAINEALTLNFMYSVSGTVRLSLLGVFPGCLGSGTAGFLCGSRWRAHGGVTAVPLGLWGTLGDTKLCPRLCGTASEARRSTARENGVSRTYNFKLKKQCAVYWRCRASPEREAHKDHITVQAIMQRVYYIYISKCFSKQQPPYEQSRITGSFGVTNDP